MKYSYKLADIIELKMLQRNIYKSILSGIDSYSI